MILRKKKKIIKTELGEAIYLASSTLNVDLSFLKDNDIRGVILSNDYGYDLDNVDFLKECRFIERVIISSYKELDYSALHHLENLQALSLNILSKDNQVIDFSCFPKLIDCRFSWRTKTKHLSECKSLQYLAISKYRKANLNELDNLTNLKILKVGQSQIETLEGISKLNQLERLELSHNRKLISLKGIEGLNSLRLLDIESCKNLKEINEIKLLENLIKLGINNCGEISSLKPIVNLKNLNWLDFWGNTKILDGDMTPSLGIEKVAFENRKHYNYTNEEIDRLNQK